MSKINSTSNPKQKQQKPEKQESLNLAEKNDKSDQKTTKKNEFGQQQLQKEPNIIQDQNHEDKDKQKQLQKDNHHDDGGLNDITDQDKIHESKEFQNSKNPKQQKQKDQAFQDLNPPKNNGEQQDKEKNKTQLIEREQKIDFDNHDSKNQNKNLSQYDSRTSNQGLSKNIDGSQVNKEKQPQESNKKQLKSQESDDDIKVEKTQQSPDTKDNVIKQNQQRINNKPDQQYQSPPLKQDEENKKSKKSDDELKIKTPLKNTKKKGRRNDTFENSEEEQFLNQLPQNNPNLRNYEDMDEEELLQNQFPLTQEQARIKEIEYQKWLKSNHHDQTEQTKQKKEKKKKTISEDEEEIFKNQLPQNNPNLRTYSEMDEEEILKNQFPQTQEQAKLQEQEYQKWLKSNHHDQSKNIDLNKKQKKKKTISEEEEEIFKNQLPQNNPNLRTYSEMDEEEILKNQFPLTEEQTKLQELEYQKWLESNHHDQSKNIDLNKKQRNNIKSERFESGKSDNQRPKQIKKEPEVSSFISDDEPVEKPNQNIKDQKFKQKKLENSQQNQETKIEDKKQNQNQKLKSNNNMTPEISENEQIYSNPQKKPNKHSGVNRDNNSFLDESNDQRLGNQNIKQNIFLDADNSFLAQDEIYGEDLDDEIEFTLRPDYKKSRKDNQIQKNSQEGKFKNRKQNDQYYEKYSANNNKTPNETDSVDDEVNEILDGVRNDSERFENKKNESQDMVDYSVIDKQKVDGTNKSKLTQRKQNSPKKLKLSQEEKRNAHLQDVYSFYCKQTYVQGKQATFDRLSLESTIMSIGKFMYFNRDFKLMDLDPEEDQNVQNLIISQFPDQPSIKQEISQYQESKRDETARRKQQRNDLQNKNIVPKSLQHQSDTIDIQKVIKIKIQKNNTTNSGSDQDVTPNHRISEIGSKTAKIQNSREIQTREIRNKTNQSDQDELISPNKKLSRNDKTPPKIDKPSNNKSTVQSETEDQPKKLKKTLVYRIENTLSKTNLAEIFRKSSSNNKFLTFEEFTEALRKLAQFIFFKQLWQAKNWKKYSDRKLKEVEIKQKPEVDQALTNRSLQTERVEDETKKQLQELSQLLFYKFLEIDDVNRFRIKMKSVRKPFEMKDDTERVQTDELKYQFKLYHPDIKNKEKLQEELDKRKEQKEKSKNIDKEKRDFYKLQQLLKFYTAQKLQEMFPDKKETIEKLIRIRNQERQKNQQIIYKPEQKTKEVKYRSQSMKESVNGSVSKQIDQMLIDWENLDQGYLKNFKPDQEARQLVSNLAQNSDNEDNIYLAEYQLEENPFTEKIKPSNKIEKYGKKGKSSSLVQKRIAAQPVSHPTQQIYQNNYNNMSYDYIRQYEPVNLVKMQHVGTKQTPYQDLSYQIELDKQMNNYHGTPSLLYNYGEVTQKVASVSQGGTDYQYQINQERNLNKRYVNNSNIQTQNINHIPVYQYQQPQQYLKQSNVHASQAVLRPQNYSPQKKQKNQSVDTMNRAKQIEIEQKRKQDLILSQVIRNQNNRVGKMQAKIY